MRLSWVKLKCLVPWYRRAQERDMEEELESLSALAEPGELGNMTRAAEEARAVWSWMWLEELQPRRAVRMADAAVNQMRFCC